MDIRIFLIGANLDPDKEIETADKDGYWTLQKLLEQYDKDVKKANSFSNIHNVSKRYWLMSYRTEGVFRTDTIEAPNELTAKTVFHHNHKGMKLIKCTETYDC